MLVPCELKSDFAMIGRKLRITSIDRAPGQLFSGTLIAVERLGSCRVQENITVPGCLGHGAVDLRVRTGPIAELSQCEPTGGTGGRPFLKRYPIQVPHRLTALAKLGENLATRA
jgi:hypothetical protein